MNPIFFYFWQEEANHLVPQLGRIPIKTRRLRPPGDLKDSEKLQQLEDTLPRCFHEVSHSHDFLWVPHDFTHWEVIGMIVGRGNYPKISYCMIPVVPHKAVAEVSEKETYSRVWLL